MERPMAPEEVAVAAPEEPMLGSGEAHL